MNIKECENGIILEDVDYFIPKDTIECGQIFRWKKEDDNSYTIIAHNRVINISLLAEKTVKIDNCNLIDFNTIWRSYFDLDTNYKDITSKISTDETIIKAIKFGKGIRILKQDNFEMMISFMISANNRIPMIQKVIENLSKSFGEFICIYRGHSYYSFPSLHALSQATVDDIIKCKAGFRSERIKAACERLSKNDNELAKLYSLSDMSYNEALNYLKSYKGIGNKVANCVILFSASKMTAFPVDVWVRRIMQHFYPLENQSDKMIEEFAYDKFGLLAGYAQQYLFYYARENGLKK